MQIFPLGDSNVFLIRNVHKIVITVRLVGWMAALMSYIVTVKLEVNLKNDVNIISLLNC